MLHCLVVPFLGPPYSLDTTIFKLGQLITPIKLEMNKLSEEDILKTEMGQKLDLLYQLAKLHWETKKLMTHFIAVVWK